MGHSRSKQWRRFPSAPSVPMRISSAHPSSSCRHSWSRTWAKGGRQEGGARTGFWRGRFGPPNLVQTRGEERRIDSWEVDEGTWHPLWWPESPSSPCWSWLRPLVNAGCGRGKAGPTRSDPQSGLPLAWMARRGLHAFGSTFQPQSPTPADQPTRSCKTCNPPMQRTHAGPCDKCNLPLAQGGCK